METVGTITILGEIVPDKVRCPYKCDGGDVCVDTKTGICSVCKKVFVIHTAKIKIVMV